MIPPADFILRPSYDPLILPEMNRLSSRVQRTLHDFKQDRLTLTLLQDQLKSYFETSLVKTVSHAYTIGCKAVNVPEDGIVNIALQRNAKARASHVAMLMTKTSHNAMNIQAAVSKKNVASRERSQGASEYEVSRIFFMGARKGWSSKRGSLRSPTKRWLSAGNNVCESCQENEDAGPIALEDTFPSGDFDPPGHLHCECYEGLYF